MTGRAWLLGILLLGAGCSDTGPSGPTTLRRDLAEPDTAQGLVPGTMVRVVSGETGQPVTNAQITLAGVEHVSDGSGRFTIDTLAPNGANLDIRATGFLDRQTLVRRGEEATFELWPSVSPTRMDADYTRALVYQSASLGGDAGELEPLERPGLDTTRVSIQPTGPIPNDPRAMESLRDAAAAITDALGGDVVYSLSGDPNGVPVTLRVSPQDESIVDDNLRAFTRCWMVRLVITRCEIVFRDVEVVRSNTTLHELGHTFGLNHSPDRAEIMGVRRVRAPRDFSARERLAMRMMLKRVPGNLFPDNDRQAPALRAAPDLRAAPVTSRIMCRHPSD